MKKIFLTLFAIVFIVKLSIAQTYSSLGSVNNGNTNWVNLGTFSLPQGGFDGYLKIYSGQGYNASIAQMAFIQLHIRSGNGGNVDANGFGFAATATSNGRGGAAFIAQINIVPNNSGASATAYTVYAYCGPYVGNGFFSAECTPGTSWTSSVTVAASSPGGYFVPFEYFLNNDTYVLGHFAVNTTHISSGYQFAVNGNMEATSINVMLFSTWPDYVFKKDYHLPSLDYLKTYIDQNHHLPEIPSESTVKKDGLNLGEMDKLLMKKVEELTLYLIEKDKELAAQKKINESQEKKLDKMMKQIEMIKEKIK